MARHLDNKCVKGLVGLQLLNSLFLGLCLLSMHDEGNCGEALLPTGLHPDHTLGQPLLAAEMVASHICCV